MLFFEKTTPQLQEKFRKFINDLHECTTGPLLKEANVLLREYRKLYRELQVFFFEIVIIFIVFYPGFLSEIIQRRTTRLFGKFRLWTKIRQVLKNRKSVKVWKF